jgi:hypothetical protein
MNSKQIATILIALAGSIGAFFAKDKLIVFITNIGGEQNVTITPPVSATSPIADNTVPSSQKISDRQKVDNSSDFIVKFKNGVEKK